jgi:hypothetical protein
LTKELEETKLMLAASREKERQQEKMLEDLKKVRRELAEMNVRSLLVITVAVRFWDHTSGSKGELEK